VAKKSNILEKAQNFVRQNKLAKAISEYEKVAQLDPNDLISSNILGDLYVRHGQKGKALTVFGGIAASYVKEGVVLKAIAVYKKIIRLAPGEDSEPYLQLAALYQSQSLMGEAIENLKVVLEYQRDNKKDKDAVETIKKILEIKPGLIRLRRELADIYIKLDNVSEARNELIAVAADLAQQDREAEAEAILNDILREDPENVKVMLSLGRIYQKNEKNDEAFEILQKILKIDSSNEDALVLFSDMLLKKGEVEKGREYLKTLLEIHSKNTAGKLLYARSCIKIADMTEAGKEYFKLAELYLENKDFEQCVETMQEFLREQPDSILAHEQMLDFYNKMGKEEESSCEYQKIAGIYASQNKFHKAANVLSKLVQNNPSDIKSRELLREYSEKAKNEPAADSVYSVELSGLDKLEDVSFEGHEEFSVAGESSETVADEVDFGDIDFELNGDDGVTEPAPSEPPKAAPDEIDFGDISFELDGDDSVAEPAPSDSPKAVPDEVDFSDISFELDGDDSLAEPAPSEPPKAAPDEVDFSDISFELGDVTEPDNVLPKDIKTPDNACFNGDAPAHVEEASSPSTSESNGSVSNGGDSFIDHIPSDKDLENSKFSVVDISSEGLEPHDELIDVGKEICDDMEKEEAKNKPKLPSYDVGDILDEFKKGVSANIDSDDYTTHYDLGIAYKEMGLWEDARKEFEISKSSLSFQLESYEMIADSYFAAGDVGSAIDNLKSGLLCKAYTNEKGVALLYRLGCLYEGDSRYDEAREAFSKVSIIRSDFEDVEKRLEKLNSMTSSGSDSENGQDDSDGELFDPTTILDD